MLLRVGLPLYLFPSSGCFFVCIFTLASFLCLPLCPACGAFDTDHRRVTSTTDIGDLVLSSPPIRRFVVDSVSVIVKMAFMSMMP